MSDADLDGSGSIDFDEFAVAMKKQMAGGAGGLGSVVGQAGSMFGWLPSFGLFSEKTKTSEVEVKLPPTPPTPQTHLPAESESFRLRRLPPDSFKRVAGGGVDTRVEKYDYLGRSLTPEGRRASPSPSPQGMRKGGTSSRNSSPGHLRGPPLPPSPDPFGLYFGNSQSMYERKVEGVRKPPPAAGFPSTEDGSFRSAFDTDRLERYFKGMPQLRQSQVIPQMEGGAVQPAGGIGGGADGETSSRHRRPSLNSTDGSMRQRRPSLTKNNSDARLARFLLENEGVAMPAEREQSPLGQRPGGVSSR